MKETFPETIITVDFGSADTEKQKLKKCTVDFFCLQKLVKPENQNVVIEPNVMFFRSERAASKILKEKFALLE